MIRTFITCCIFLAVLCSSSAQASGMRFDSRFYLYSNHIIIEGVLISDVEVEAEEYRGLLYSNNLACVLVNRLVRQVEGPAVCAGDTICFKYRPSSRPLNPPPPGMVRGKDSNDYKLNAEVGQSGLYSFYWYSKGGFRKGRWFSIEKDQEQEVLELIGKLEADFDGTIANLRIEYPYRVIDWSKLKR